MNEQEQKTLLRSTLIDAMDVMSLIHKLTKEHFRISVIATCAWAIGILQRSLDISQRM